MAIAPIMLSTLTTFDQANADCYKEVLAEGLDVLNMSFGYPGPIELYEEPDLRDALPMTIKTLAQSGRRDKTVLVWAAGNSNERLCRPGTENCVGDTETDHLGLPAGLLNSSSPDLLTGLMARIEELRGHSVATGEDGEIVRFSNRCGLAANWCIAAPGLRVWAAYFGPYRGDIIRGYVPASGTSFAAPTGTRLRSGDSHGGSMGPGLRLGFGETPGGVDIGHARLAQDAITLSVGRPDGVIATAVTTEADRNAKPVSDALIS